MMCRRLQSAGQAHKSRICSSAGQHPLPQQLFTESEAEEGGVSTITDVWTLVYTSEVSRAPPPLWRECFNSEENAIQHMFCRRSFPVLEAISQKNNIETILCINAQSIAQACVTGNFPVSSPVPQSHCCL